MHLPLTPLYKRGGNSSKKTEDLGGFKDIATDFKILWSFEQCLINQN
jgi:hypothetical protein